MSNIISLHRGKILKAKRDFGYFVTEIMGFKPLCPYQVEMLKRFSIKVKLQLEQGRLWMEENNE